MAPEVVRTFLGHRFSGHGYNRINDDQHMGGTFRRVIWLIVSVGMTSVLVQQLYLSFTNFLSEPTSTSIEIQQPPKNDFPAVTICPMSPMKPTKLEDLLQTNPEVANYPALQVDILQKSMESIHQIVENYYQRLNESTEGLNDNVSYSLYSDIVGVPYENFLAAEIPYYYQQSYEALKEFMDGFITFSNLGGQEVNINGVPVRFDPLNETHRNILGFPDAYLFPDENDVLTMLLSYSSHYFQQSLNTKGANFDLLDIMENCVFKSSDCTGYYGEVRSDLKFYPYPDPYWKTCFYFNHALFHDSKTPRETIKSIGLGRDKGLEFVLKSRDADYLGILGNPKGFAVFVFDPNAMGLRSDYVYIPNDMVVDIAVQRSEFYRISLPDEICAPDDYLSTLIPLYWHESTQRSWTAYGDYEQLSCMELMSAMEIAKQCGCLYGSKTLGSITFDVFKDTYRPCGFFHLICVEEILVNHTIMERCPPACKTVTYKLATATTPMDQQGFKDRYLWDQLIYANPLGSVNPNDTRYSKVKVYFPTPNVEILRTNKVWTSASFVGNIGGMVGLYIGMSFITMFEVVEFLIDVVFALGSRLFNKRGKQKKVYDNWQWRTASGAKIGPDGSLFYPAQKAF